jgi:hypothetical protein
VSTAAIRQAFEARLKAWADARVPPLPVAWQNVAFDPPAGTYLESFLLPAGKLSRSLDGSVKVYRGVFQVTVVLPAGTGPGAAEAIESELETLFAESAPMQQGSLRIHVTSPMSSSPAIQREERYAVPVSAAYTAA